MNSVRNRVSHTMPAFKYRFFEKSIKKALLSTFRALFALLQTGTAERLMKT